MSNNHNNSKQAGYTLIEVVITMFLTATVFVGVYALFAKAMNYDKEGQHEIIASELAQEGIEMIKNKKEKNEMDWAVWNPNNTDANLRNIANLTTFRDIGNLSTPCNPSLTWDSNGDNYNFNCDSSNTTIRYDKSAKKYITNCTAGDCVGPEYARECTTKLLDVDSDGKNDALNVSCTVKWKSDVLNGGERSVKAELVLTDWER